MTIGICPHCGERYVTDKFNTDIIHKCDSGNTSIDEEDVVVIGNYQDERSTEISYNVESGLNPSDWHAAKDDFISYTATNFVTPTVVTSSSYINGTGLSFVNDMTATYPLWVLGISNSTPEKQNALYKMYSAKNGALTLNFYRGRAGKIVKITNGEIVTNNTTGNKGVISVANLGLSDFEGSGNYLLNGTDGYKFLNSYTPNGEIILGFEVNSLTKNFEFVSGLDEWTTTGSVWTDNDGYAGTFSRESTRVVGSNNFTISQQVNLIENGSYWYRLRTNERDGGHFNVTIGSDVNVGSLTSYESDYFVASTSGTVNFIVSGVGTNLLAFDYIRLIPELQEGDFVLETIDATRIPNIVEIPSNRVMWQGVSNELQGTDAALVGKNKDKVTKRGNRTATHRTRQHSQFVEVNK